MRLRFFANAEVKMTRFHVVPIVAAFGALPLIAFADPEPSRVVSVPSAPVAVTRCFYDPTGFYNAGQTRANITNRTTGDLLTVSVRFQYFDDEGLIGQSVMNVLPPQMLASGDTASYLTTMDGKPFSDPVDVLKYTTCRIQSATFTRGRRWAYGQAYPGKLLTISHDSSTPSGAIAEQDRGNVGVATNWPSSLTVKTGESWITNVPENLPDNGSFVHIRVTLAATEQLDVSPSEFRANVTLPNGATKTYAPMLQPAPRVLHGGLLNYTGDPNQLGPSVAPNEDFGAIGTMSLRPSVTVSTVLTYKIDSMSPSDTIHVALVR